MKHRNGASAISFGGWQVWGPIILGFIVVGVLVVVLDRHRDKKKLDKTTGKVVGVVGRMGSGKSYFAVRMAYKRLCAGARVCTNFSMNLPDHLRGNWRQFHGWEQFAELEDCVVIVDEAHLWAPSSEHVRFPMVARWKLAQARKFGLDVYWISQHEDRVNRTLRDLTNLIYVCRSYGEGRYFSALAYEPEKLRKKDQHIERRGYKFDLRVASLYNTLEILDVDDHAAKGMDGARLVRERRNRSTGGPRATEQRSGASSAGRTMKPRPRVT